MLTLARVVHIWLQQVLQELPQNRDAVSRNKPVLLPRCSQLVLGIHILCPSAADRIVGSALHLRLLPAGGWAVMGGGDGDAGATR
ncbi:unnamed protein product [Lota lota]